ncbi:MAG: DUF6527 family protein [Pseudomonadota bacterium]|nr:DUF6527 family protein [Pseudomonadota bacterium]
MAEIKTSFPAFYVDDLLDGDHPPGAFKFYANEAGEIIGMNAVMPFNNEQGKQLATFPFTAKHKHHWQWDGNREKPTLSPSLHLPGHWHGYLRGGEFKSV